MFDDFKNDNVELIKADGRRQTGLLATVSRNRVFMAAEGVLVEPNDLIIRIMSNGLKETYRVIDPGFYEKMLGQGSHYQMRVDKLGIQEAQAAANSITYNISGSNARVNNNSVDQSTNVVQIDQRVSEHIEALRTAINRSSLSPSEVAEANDVIDEIDGAFRSGKPKKTVVLALLKALPHVANVASIVSALSGLIPA